MSSNVLYFSGDVDNESVISLVDEVAKLLEEGEKDLTMYVTSDGGDLFEALGTYDHVRYLLKQNKAKLTVIAKSHVFSAGTVLLMMGDDRYSFEHTAFMLHEPWQYPWGDGKQKIHANETHARLQIHQLSVGMLANVFAHVTGRPDQEWEDLLNSPSEHYFDAQSALYMGLIQGIVI